jgi:hypothetical protein
VLSSPLSRICCAFAAALIGLLPATARAQMDAGSLRVLVLDQSAGVVPGAAQPNGSYPSATFGSITSAGEPRIVQLAVRFGF